MPDQPRDPAATPEDAVAPEIAAAERASKQAANDDHVDAAGV